MTMEIPSALLSESNIRTALAILTIGAAHLYVVKSVIREKKTGETPPPRSGPVARVFSDKDAVSKELCSFVATLANEAIDARGVFHLAVADGSLLDALAGLAATKDRVDFSKVVLSFANHKCVDPNSEKAAIFKSKKKFASEAGIREIIFPSSTPNEGGDGSEEVAYYAKALKDAGIPHYNGLPVLDLILVGLGADGHVGSCHPMGPAVADSKSAVTSSPKEGEPASITFTIETMNAARNVAVVVCGGNKGKKEAVKRALRRPAETPRGTFPAQLLDTPTIFLDAEAAEDL